MKEKIKNLALMWHCNTSSVAITAYHRLDDMKTGVLVSLMVLENDKSKKSPLQTVAKGRLTAVCQGRGTT